MPTAIPAADPNIAELHAEIARLEAGVATEKQKLEQKLAARARRQPVLLSAADEKRAQEMADKMIAKQRESSALLLCGWPRAAIVLDGVMFVAQPTADGISVSPSDLEAPGWAHAYAADATGALNELRLRDTDARVLGKLERGTKGHKTLATEVLRSLIEFSTFRSING
jgi:hypothetical protein